MGTTPANAMNQSGVKGIVTWDGTATESTQALTQYNVLTGSANANAFNQITPSATSGIPFISQGASAQPVYGTAVVGGGGTGNTTFTAYSVITAGTTATGAFQNVSGVGTSGQVLTSNGASALPTWQPASSGGGSNTAAFMYDDFFSPSQVNLTNDSCLRSGLNWITAGGYAGPSWPNAAGDNGHCGVIGNASTSLYGQLFLQGTPPNTNTYVPIYLGGGTVTLTWIFKIVNISVSSPRYTLLMGLSDTYETTAPANFAGISYTDNVNSGNWQYITTAASTSTTNNSSTAGATGWHNFTMTVNAGGTSVSFVLDGVTLGSNTTHIPASTAGLSPYFIISRAVGTVAANTVLIDMMSCNINFTTAR